MITEKIKYFPNILPEGSLFTKNEIFQTTDTPPVILTKYKATKFNH